MKLFLLICGIFNAIEAVTNTVEYFFTFSDGTIALAMIQAAVAIFFLGVYSSLK